MAIPRLIATVCVGLVCSSATLAAQQPVPAPETRLSTATLEAWLHGSDPRLAAKAADFALQQHLTQILDQIPAILEHATIPFPQSGESDQRLAVLALIDAVIQQPDAHVSADAIGRIAAAFPAQALVLVGRLPIEESRSLLDDWSYGMTPSWDTRRLERVAAMMLAQHPTPEFAARIAAAAGQQMVVHVAANDSGSGFGSSACGDFLGGNQRPGWPPIYTYDLVENDSQQNPPHDGALLVIDLAGDRIVSRRFLENQPWGSCNGVENLDDVTRHRLLAYWLGVAPANMSWQPQSGPVIVWKDQAGYERDLGALVNEQRAKMLETWKGLQDRGLLSDKQAESISPKITVSIECDLTPCPVK
jgi:hypothetical protein